MKRTEKADAMIRGQKYVTAGDRREITFVCAIGKTYIKVLNEYGRIEMLTRSQILWREHDEPTATSNQ